MTISEAVQMRVSSLPAVIAIAGSRIYREKIRQHTAYPAVLVREIDDISTYGLRGPVGVIWARVQIDAGVDEDSGVNAQAVAEDLAAAVHGDGLGPNASGIDGFIGQIGSPGVTILGAFRKNRLRQYEAGERRIVNIQQDYVVCYRAA